MTKIDFLARVKKKTRQILSLKWDLNNKHFFEGYCIRGPFLESNAAAVVLRPHFNLKNGEVIIQGELPSLRWFICPSIDPLNKPP